MTPELKVTPEMIEAGLEELYGHPIMDPEDSTMKRAVEQVYRVMAEIALRDHEAALTEWRDARQAFWNVGIAEQRFPPEVWTRLGNAEHRLMELARELESRP